MASTLEVTDTWTQSKIKQERMQDVAESRPMYLVYAKHLELFA